MEPKGESNLSEFQNNKFSEFGLLLLEIVVEKKLANVLELIRYLEIHGDDYNTNMPDVNYTISKHAEVFELYFDGVYQERNSGQKLTK